MKPIDLSRAPAPTQDWLRAFMEHMLAIEPRFRPPIALELALTAHGVCWLLDPDEAAELWWQAVRRHGWVPCE